MRVGYADLRIGAAAQFPPHHERYDAGQVGLVGEHLQVEHQLRVLFVCVGHARRLRHFGQVAAALLLGHLNPPLDVANGVEILIEPGAVAGPDFPVQFGYALGQGVEQAAVLADALEPHLRVGGADVAEEPLEHQPRIGFHRQRRVRVAPGDGARVHATEADVAGTENVVFVEREFERTELGFPAEPARHELVDRNRGLEIALGAGRGRSGEKAGRGAGVDAGVARHAVESGQHQHAVAVSGHGPQDPGELEISPLGGGSPGFHRHAVGHIDHA